MADDGDGKIDPKAQHELNLMTEAMRDCKIKKAGQGDLTCLMERCDGTPFVAVSYTHLTLPTIYSV